MWWSIWAIKPYLFSFLTFLTKNCLFTIDSHRLTEVSYFWTSSYILILTIDTRVVWLGCSDFEFIYENPGYLAVSRSLSGDCRLAITVRRNVITIIISITFDLPPLIHPWLELSSSEATCHILHHHRSSGIIRFDSVTISGLGVWLQLNLELLTAISINRDDENISIDNLCLQAEI